MPAVSCVEPLIGEVKLHFKRSSIILGHSLIGCFNITNGAACHSPKQQVN